MTDFKHTDQDGDHMEVTDSVRLDDHAYVVAVDGPGVFVSKADAPAVALAILEAAGWTSSTSSDPAALPANAVYTLRRHVEEAEKAAKLAADEEALDREALELLNAATESSYPTMPDNVIGSVWRRAARKARELHS
ncbi:hypothetical protein SEA_CREWMATE_58 [Arthrobacter phage Crewmate]|uniref:Uncharacterized protein n=1 Tax=Arthrobacter phage Crewmate TaxID=2832317 RepID=A0AA48Y3L3_9CAUD|nr:hypothetical protein PQE17_gp58 [Arthrobacter phage Crewmate]UIW13310.1 hypothetical protein SEA_CREWMATE_58 [Arthrobacter phage Crewmate]